MDKKNILCNIEKQISDTQKKISERLFDNKIYVRTNKAAEILERSVGQIRNMVWRGQLKAKKWQGRLYFDLEYLLSRIDGATYV
jgi:hypothetical protein